MGIVEHPFELLVAEEPSEEFAILQRKPANATPSAALMSGGAAIGRLHGFALDDSPMVGDLDTLPGQAIAARTTVSLRREMIGTPVVILYERGNPQLPIIVGVMQQSPIATEQSALSSQAIAVHADDERYEIRAEREIMLRCGDSSITLTRAGKVIIKGNYILSRSSGYNKIKGAAVDIN
jgi:uncharacterized protein DUF6484